MTRTALAAGVLLVWLGAVGVLMRREYFGDAADSAIESAQSVPPGASFYAVAIAGTQIGYYSSTVDTLPDGISVLDIVEVWVPIADTVKRVNARTRASLDHQLRLTDFELSVRGEDERYTVSGAVADSAIELEVSTEVGSYSMVINVPERVVLPSTVPLTLAFRDGLARGATHSLLVFDPLTFHTSRLDVDVFADSTFMVPDSALMDSTTMTWSPVHYDTVHAWRTSQRLDGRQFDSWVDDLGRMLSITTPQGYSITRSVFEVVYENFRRHEEARPLPAVAFGSRVAEPTEPEVGRMTVLIGSASQFDLVSDNQSVSGDTVRVVRSTMPDEPRRFRIQNAPGAYMTASPFFQIGDPRIGALARRITNQTRDARRAVRRLTEWVHGEVAPAESRTLPNALQLTETRAGNANDKVVLLTGLLRSIGIPAKTVTGFYYAAGSFGLHSWVEVYLNEWIPIDPVLGQVPADARHVRLLDDALARPIQVAEYLGAVTVQLIGLGS